MLFLHTMQLLLLLKILVTWLKDVCVPNMPLAA